MKAGFIGLGQMGAAMAARLLQAGHQVTVYNRSPEKAKPLAEKGATIASRVMEACHGAEVVFTMLADNRAVEGVLFGGEGLLRHLSRGAVHVSSGPRRGAVAAAGCGA